jgi:predicted amidohydrolase YtcJ
MGDDRLRFLGLGEILVFKVNDGVRLAPGFKAADDGKDELFKVASLAAQRKYPLEVHAYTDDAAKQILDVFERVSQTHDLRDLRWCIAHISTGTAETFARMKKLGICYSIQMGPYWEAFQIARYQRAFRRQLCATHQARARSGADGDRRHGFNEDRGIQHLEGH